MGISVLSVPTCPSLSHSHNNHQPDPFATQKPQRKELQKKYSSFVCESLARNWNNNWPSTFFSPSSIDDEERREANKARDQRERGRRENWILWNVFPNICPRHSVCHKSSSSSWEARIGHIKRYNCPRICVSSHPQWNKYQKDAVRWTRILSPSSLCCPRTDFNPGNNSHSAHLVIISERISCNNRGKHSLLQK